MENENNNCANFMHVLTCILADSYMFPHSGQIRTVFSVYALAHNNIIDDSFQFKHVAIYLTDISFQQQYMHWSFNVIHVTAPSNACCYKRQQTTKEGGGEFR